uniref:RxLR effector candidate protein n=1 Tax=Hyaloperonospora arabidopsidis (strain Emoy2) TaxID=559515 RepID=M4BCS6_HYAAE
MQLNQAFLIVTLLLSLTASADFAGAANDHVHQASATTNVKDPFAVASERIDNFGDSTTSTAIAASEEERFATSVSATGRTHAILPSAVAPSEPTEMVTNSQYLGNGVFQRIGRFISGFFDGDTKSRRLRQL